MKRLLDIILVISSLPLTLPVSLAVAIAIKLESNGPALYWSNRVGKDNRIFRMPKFRSMLVDSPELAPEVFHDATSYITKVGNFIRHTSLDELPQLWSVLKGDMSLIGPRPPLYNETYLINLRTEKGVHVLLPGISGWAQINGRNNISIEEKVDFDTYYLHHQSIALDIKIIALTIIKVLKREDIVH